MSNQNPSKICVDWPEYLALIERLCVNILHSGFHVQQVVGIARGGLIPGQLVSHVSKAPLAVLSLASYPDDGTAQEKMHFSRDLTTARPLKRCGVLVVDDLTETGVTLAETVKWLCHWYDIDPSEVKTAVVWHKSWSAHVPDFFAELVPEGPDGQRPWIIQPPEGFAAKFR